ncbi:MAG: UDP-N-acetylmuramoyl-tripeptide--D-alanyl-D-alanine ligase [Nitrospirae bacterium]|nr:UDP-N-acetylmuramoyl-tripeptide--D-alanyl-D-alanine ligase [Nitrospirota bacterium]
MTLTVREIINATGGKLLTDDSRTFSGVSIDSRSINEGEIFFAIRGEKFDGHTFLDKALLKGSGAVVDSRPAVLAKDRTIIFVKDTLGALQDLAHFLRTRLDIPVIAVTGSNGKTTTKEMIYAVLSKRFNTLKNEGNLNNHVGLPLSLMKLQPEHEAVVVEMGMNAPGEIKRLCEIAFPTHGVITNIGTAHIGRLGSHEAIRNAKLEILNGLKVVVVNADDSLMMQGIAKAGNFSGDVVTFSINNDSQVMAKDIQTTENGINFTLNIKDAGSVPVSLNVHGTFNVYNALAASAAGFSLGVSAEEIRAALESFRAFSMRFEIVKTKGMTIINDSYNANPSSMEGSLKELVRLGVEGRKVAVLGDMRELDEYAEDAHRTIGKMVSEMGVNVFIAVGEMMSLAAEECLKAKKDRPSPEVYTFKNIDSANENIMDILKHGDSVLIKGSRSMQMDKVAGRILNVI